MRIENFKSFAKRCINQIPRSEIYGYDIHHTLLNVVNAISHENQSGASHDTTLKFLYVILKKYFEE